MKKSLLIVSTLFSLMLSPVWAYEIAGINIPDTQQISPDSAEVQLNGAGIRTKFFFDIYVGGLYLTEKQDKLDAILANQGPKRILMHFLYKEVAKKDLDAAWWDGFEDNLAAQELDALKPQIQAFTGFFRDVHEGDVVYLDYLPEEGTVVSINEEKTGVVSGDDFYPALLKIWLGEKPVTGKLKKAMLGIK